MPTVNTGYIIHVFCCPFDCVPISKWRSVSGEQFNIQISALKFIIKELMNTFIKKYQLRNCDQTFNHAPTEAEGVIKFTRNRPCSIIALGTHGRKGLAHIISGSVAEDLAQHASPTVWTCHMK